MADIQQEETQQELFTEFSGLAKRAERFPLIAKSHKPLFFSTTVEQIILVAIGLILAGSFVFFLGVLRGKHLSARPSQFLVQKKAEISPAIPVKNTALQPAIAAKQANRPAIVIANNMGLPVPTSASKPYTIQLSTYRKQDLAEKEVVLLRQNGFYSSANPSNGYFVVCVGQYETKDAAKKDLKFFSAKYKGCFLRRRV
jgi:hypothetical protein